MNATETLEDTEGILSLIEKYDSLISNIESPISLEEAKVIISIFPEGFFYDLHWDLVRLIESFLEKRNNTTLAHECLHCLNLYHTFESRKLENPNQKYVFNNSDGNIMSYEEGRKNSWRWQWLLARIAIFKKFE